MAKHTLNILRCSHRKMFKLCLAILQHCARKGSVGQKHHHRYLLHYRVLNKPLAWPFFRILISLFVKTDKNVLIFRLKSNTLLWNLKTTQYYENSLKNSENSFLGKFGYCWNQDNKFDLWFFRLFDNPLSNLPFQVYGDFGLSGPNPRPPYEVKTSGLQLIFNVLR